MRAMARPETETCRAWQLMMRFFFAQRERLPFGGDTFELSPVQCHVLHLLEPDQPVPMGSLAETLGCDASNVTGLVDRLEARGLLRRQPSTEDRRVKVLRLTQTGARLRAQLLRRVTTESCRLSALSSADRRALVRILERLVDDE